MSRSPIVGGTQDGIPLPLAYPHAITPARKGEFDLRTPGAAAELEKVLAVLDVKALFAGDTDAAGG